MMTTYLLLSTLLLTYLILSIIILTCPPDQVSWVSGSGTWSTPCLITVLPRKK